MEKVTGIGGFFFRAEEPERLAAWYRDHLGINPIPRGPDDRPWVQEAGPTAFAPFPSDSDHFGRRNHMWMLNFRVNNLDAMIAQLVQAGITVEKGPTDSPYGSFARLHDPEGNPIELWEAPTSS